MSANAESPRVGVIMGSDSDLGTMGYVGQALRDSGLQPHIDYEMDVVSAHRTPDYMTEYAETAEERGLQVIIPGAGGSAHLPGMVASETTLPVAGVAVTSHPEVMNRALGSLIGMPEGKPLATFQSKGGAYKAGRFAAKILAQVEAGTSRVAIVANSESEWETMRHVGRALDALGLTDNDYDRATLVSEGDLEAFAEQLRAQDIATIITSSSSTHTLPEQLHLHTDVPILGVAITRNPDVMSDGLDALVNSDVAPIGAQQGPAGAFNAGLLAARILAINDPDIKARIDIYNDELKTTVQAKGHILRRLSDEAYDDLSKQELQDLIDAEIRGADIG